METNPNQTPVTTPRQDADAAIDAFINSLGPDVLDLGAIQDILDRETVTPTEIKITEDSNDAPEDTIVTPANYNVADELDWADHGSILARPLVASMAAPMNGWPRPTPYLLSEPAVDTKFNFDILNDGKNIEPYRGDLSFLDDYILGNATSDTNHNVIDIPTNNEHITDDAIDEVKDVTPLDKARDELAELTIKLRGKHSSKLLNKKLRQKYEDAADRYAALYSDESKLAILDLKIEGKSDEEINQLAETMGLIEETKARTAAELKAYEKLNPRAGKIAKRWASYGIVKKVLYGGAAGMVATVGLPAAVAAAGATATLIAGSAVAVKAAKTVGMHKLNKNSKQIKEFDKKANQDQVYVSQYVAKSLENTSEGVDQVDYLSSAVSEAMASSIDLRIEHDQRANRKQMTIAVGSIAIGAALGFLAHSIIQRNGFGHTSGKTGRINTDKPGASGSPVPKPAVDQPPHSGPGRPLPGSSHDQPPHRGPNTGSKPIVDRPAPGGNSNASGSELPTATPTENLPIPNFGLSRESWEVANDFAPGKETAFMQRGIDAYNHTNGTHFALTPHNGSTWIMDGQHAVNQLQMEQMNRMMVTAFADKLADAA